ncbi:MAG: phosphatidate cytidylyltransferase [Saprospiraceae bacterium]|nr:phosphatidate cytidylyltransferase [Saprospiraceae bacterium]
MTNFQQRSVTGFIFAGTILTCSHYGGIPLLVMLAIVVIMCLYEWTQIIFKLDGREANIPMPFVISFVGLCLFFFYDFYNEQIDDDIIWYLMLAYIGYFLFFMFRIFPLIKNIPFNILLGFVYIITPTAAALKIGTDLMWLLPFLWCSDTGAYFVGKYFGSTPLLPAVSPKKTVEGLLGGFITCLLYAAILMHFKIIELPITGLCLSLAAAGLGTLGDLSESLVKRQAKIKDSSHFLPGHGGFLDRFDSFLFFVPAAYFILKHLH